MSMTTIRIKSLLQILKFLLFLVSPLLATWVALLGTLASLILQNMSICLQALANLTTRVTATSMRRMRMAVLCIVLATTNATPVTTPSASSDSSLNAQAQWGAEGCGVDRLLELAAQVECSGACSLPGCTIKYDSFMTCMRRAQSRGYVRDDHAEFVAQGLRHGFDLGLDRSLLTGNRVFKNWASAIEGRKQVTAAINKRMDSGKSLLMGPWRAVEKALRARGILDYFVFPMGAVGKKDDPTVLRPTDDHRRSF